MATATASGKSLVFMTAAADILLRNSHAQMLVSHPVKALIQDQIEKWIELLRPFDLVPGFIDGVCGHVKTDGDFPPLPSSADDAGRSSPLVHESP